MKPIEVFLYEPFRKHGSPGVHRLRASGSVTVKEVLRRLVPEVPGLNQVVASLDDPDFLGHQVLLVVDGDVAGPDTPVAPGQRLMVLPPFSGGIGEETL